MNELLIGILKSVWFLLLEMSPYLLFGFFIAGVLNLIIPREKIYTHLSGNKLSSIIKASLFGVPLPLCSCGVIPVAAYLRKEGAGKSSTVSFLSSTPTTGVDSILATYSLLGPLFAIIRPIAAFFAGIMSGSLTGILEKKHNEDKIKLTEGNSCIICNSEDSHSHNFLEKIKYILQYGFIELIDDAGKWILIGVIAGGIIGFIIPGDFIEQYLGNPLLAYPIMLLISIPMYICATGSIPIAAALIIKGMTPGAGLIFLIAGPATNTATLAFVSGKLGKRILFIYLFSIIITALLFGLIVDHIWKISGEDMNLITGGMKMLPMWLKIFSAVILSGLMIRAIGKNLSNKFFKKNKEIIDMKGNYKVQDMTCQHCVNTIENALKPIQGIEKINISLHDKLVQIDGEYDENSVITAIQKAGYSIEKK
ncbi:MAG: SO_0444 family Cu/Zn efflux transporter [Armatimonadetes bacterium]|nr:SO_0444 family Cu/Zn efflux transporter [Armatimonadota bacterium]